MMKMEKVDKYSKESGEYEEKRKRKTGGGERGVRRTVKRSQGSKRT